MNSLPEKSRPKPSSQAWWVFAPQAAEQSKLRRRKTPEWAGEASTHTCMCTTYASTGDETAFNTSNADLHIGFLVAREAEITGTATHSRMVGTAVA